MIDLREVGIWVGLIDESVELFNGFPYGHLSARLCFEFISSFEIVGNCLFLMLFTIKVLDPVASFLVLPEMSLVFVVIKLQEGFCLHGCTLPDPQCILKDINLINVIRQSFKGQAITVVIKVLCHIGFINRAWCHSES